MCVANWRSYVARFIQRLDAAAPAARPDQPVLQSPFSLSHPATWEYLTETTFDGRARETSTVLVSVEGGRLRACLRDRDNGLVLWASGETWEALWANLEARLAGSAEPDWRVDRFAQKGARKK